MSDQPPRVTVDELMRRQAAEQPGMCIYPAWRPPQPGPPAAVPDPAPVRPEPGTPPAGQFCGRHWSWLCQAGYGQCRQEATARPEPVRLEHADPVGDGVDLVAGRPWWRRRWQWWATHDGLASGGWTWTRRGGYRRLARYRRREVP